MIDPAGLDAILTGLILAPAKSVVPLKGISGGIYRIDLQDGMSVVLKSFEGKKTLPMVDAFAAGLLASTSVPVTKFLLVDDSRTHLPFGFALTSYLAGTPATSFATRPDFGTIFDQIGGLARKLHTVTVQGFGSFPEPTHLSNSGYIWALANHAFERFLHYGADPHLSDQLCFLFERDFDAIVPASRHAVFAHDDLHPGNVLVVETEAGLSISGLIDFGNARAHSAVMDLAKTILICEHMAPGSGPAILKGYGPIDHPRPQEALAYYNMLHRVTMWWWLRHIGVLATADAESDLMDALRATGSGCSQPL